MHYNIIQIDLDKFTVEHIDMLVHICIEMVQDNFNNIRNYLWDMGSNQHIEISKSN